MSKYYKFDKNFNKDEVYTFVRPKKYHDLKKELPETEERVFAIVVDSSKYGTYFRYDTIRKMKYAPPHVGYRIKFGDGCVEYDDFCKDDTRNIYWFEIDHKHFINSLY